MTRRGGSSMLLRRPRGRHIAQHNCIGCHHNLHTTTVLAFITIYSTYTITVEYNTGLTQD